MEKKKHARKISKNRFSEENKTMLSLPAYLISMLKPPNFPGCKVSFTVPDRTGFMDISEFLQKLISTIHLWLSRHMYFCVQIAKLLSQTFIIVEKLLQKN